MTVQHFGNGTRDVSTDVALHLAEVKSFCRETDVFCVIGGALPEMEAALRRLTSARMTMAARIKQDPDSDFSAEAKSRLPAFNQIQTSWGQTFRQLSARHESPASSDEKENQSVSTRVVLGNALQTMAEMRDFLRITGDLGNAQRLQAHMMAFERLRCNLQEPV